MQPARAACPRRAEFHAPWKKRHNSPKAQADMFTRRRRRRDKLISIL